MSLQKVSGSDAVALIHVCVNTHGCTCSTKVTVLVAFKRKGSEMVLLSWAPAVGRN